MYLLFLREVMRIKPFQIVGGRTGGVDADDEGLDRAAPSPERLIDDVPLPRGRTATCEGGVVLGLIMLPDDPKTRPRRALLLMTLGVRIALQSPATSLQSHKAFRARCVSNDTEYAVFVLVLSISLVLLVCKLIFSGALKLSFKSVRGFLRDVRVKHTEVSHTFFLLFLRYSSLHYGSDLQRSAPAGRRRFGVSSRLSSRARLHRDLVPPGGFFRCTIHFPVRFYSR